MTIKDLFRLLIKIMSLYFFIIAAYSSLPTIFIMAIGDKNPYSLITIITSILISTGFFIFLILKADWIIRVLKLDNGFDNEKIDITEIRQKHIFNLAVIVIGGVLFLTNFPIVLTNIVMMFKYSAKVNGETSDLFVFKNEMQIGIYFLNTILGYLMITNHSKISQLIEKISEKDENKNAA